MSDPYVDENGTLHNLLGITDARVLAEVEFEITALRLEALDRAPLAGNYDLEHLCRFHRYLFRDVYQWAGELRTVDIAKGDQLFCLAQHIESAAGDVFARVGQVRADFQQHRDRIPISMADLYGDINALHPFREGNERTQRVFLRQLARDHGTRLTGACSTPLPMWRHRSPRNAATPAGCTRRFGSRPVNRLPTTRLGGSNASLPATERGSYGLHLAVRTPCIRWYLTW